MIKMHQPPRDEERSDTRLADRSRPQTAERSRGRTIARSRLLKAAIAIAVIALFAACAARVPRMAAPLSYAPTPIPVDEPFRATPPASVPLDTSPTFDVTRGRLSNGMELLLVPRRGLPIFSARLVALRGSRDLPPGLQREELLGLASFVVQREHESSPRANVELRPSVDCYADSCQVSLSGLVRNFDGALDVLADLAIRPRFPDTLLASAQNQFRVFAERMGGSQGGSVNDNIRSLLFPPQDAYSPIHQADRALLQRVTMKAMGEAYTQVFQPQHTVLIVAGDLDIAKLRASAERAFGPWLQTRPALIWTGAGPPFPAAPGRTILVDYPAALSHAYVAVRGPTRGDPSFDAMLILSYLLSTPKGDLFEEIRSSLGAAYVIQADFVSMRVASYWQIGGPFDLDKAPQAVAAVLGSIRKARDTSISATDLEGARTRFIAKYRASSSTTTGLTNMIANALSAGLPLEHLLAQPDRVSRLTAEDIQRAARTWLPDTALRLVVVGPYASIVNRYHSLGIGDVEWRDRVGEPLR